MSTITYHQTIRKLVVGFGNLFNNIQLARFNPDGSEQERFLVPIAYAAKELYVQRLEGDPDLDKKVQLTLPRMSFELTGLEYDPTRKQNTNVKAFAQTPAGVVSQYNPVPYNFDFSLCAYVRNIEDGTQIIEHILPFFTPDYTIKINLIPEMGIIKEIPIVLKSTDYEVKYEGNRESDTRLIIWTVNFTVKGFIFGATTATGLITHSITNILTGFGPADAITLIMNPSGNGTFKTSELAYQGYSPAYSTASGKVTEWSNNHLTIVDVSGNFVSNLPVIGLQSNAKYTFLSYLVNPARPSAVIDVVPNPTNANANSNYTYTTTITEFN